MSDRHKLVQYCDSPIIYTVPDRLALPPSWIGHIPFAFWVTQMTEPRVFVELGTHTGSSYCAFCQAVRTLKLPTSCYSVDTWRGDAHAGFYGDETFRELADYHDPRYGGFSVMMRSTFDDALDHFTDGTIDLLHIDGYHTYEAVKHDFETWKRKLSPRGVVLFHDTNVRARDFGVARFFEELGEQYPVFNFLHSYGLGVAAVGSEVPEPLQMLTSKELPTEVAHEVRAVFSRLGNALIDRVDLARVRRESESFAAQIDALQQSFVQREAQFESALAALRAENKDQESQLARTDEVLQALEKRIVQERKHWAKERSELLLVQMQSRDRSKTEQSRRRTREQVTRDDAIARAEQLQHDIRAELTASRAQFAALEREFRRQQVELQVLYQSPAWRATAPLRAVEQLFHSGPFRPAAKALKLCYWTATKQLAAQLEARKVAERIRQSGLFDRDWYCSHYPEVEQSGSDPILHFVQHGAGEGKNPHPLFDTRYYLEKNADVANSGGNPLDHFIRWGMSECRDPHPLFDVAYYRTQVAGSAAEKLNPLEHFVRHGAEQRLNPHPLFQTNYYLENAPDVAQTGINPLIHYVTLGWSEDRVPNALFQPRFYLSGNPDVAQQSLNPLIHFARYGWREGRNPHPLFDVTHYRHHYSHLLGPDENPLSHFFQHGVTAQTNPCELFDTRYYLGRYPDVASSNMNPLEHFLVFGWRENRDPSASFDVAFYLQQNPDVADAGINPLEHYQHSGRAEGRETTRVQRFRIPREARLWRDYLPAAGGSFVQPELQAPVSIVVPVYRGYGVTRACIESVLGARVKTPYRLILINDCSPEAEVERYLRELPSLPQLEVHHNVENLGFVRTVNLGMTLHRDADVVLLNSDTVVPDGWLDRLVAHAHRERRIGTVTPCSNNATLCNFPTLKGFAHFGSGESVGAFDRALAAANFGRAVEIPTAVGFCMYIRRPCLEQVGLFDFEAFGKGYGEENDFCLKATALGWKHLQACDTFVFHEGEASFQGESSPGKAVAARVIRERYPHYEATVASHFSQDPAAPYRVAGLAASYRASELPVILFVSHQLKGGTEKHLQDLLTRLDGHARVLIMRPAPYSESGADVVLELPAEGLFLQLSHDRETALEFLAEFLPTWGVDRVHVHHTVGFPFPVIQLLHSMRLPFDFTVHDYFSICPQIYLTDAKGSYCGEPDAASCNTCIQERPSWGASDIVAWRLLKKPYIVNADRVICPSRDVMERMRGYYPEANFVVFPHTSGVEGLVPRCVPSLNASEPLRLAVLGVLGPAKGSEIVASVAKLIAERQVPIELHLIGFFDGNQDFGSSPFLRIHGPYQDADLPQLLEELDPHLIWFPSRCPETFSFTLSAALLSGRPIVAPKLGAFPERLAGRDSTWMVDWKITAPEMLAQLEGIRSEIVAGRFSGPMSGFDANAARRSLGEQGAPTYVERYLTGVEKHPAPRIYDLRARREKRGRMSALVLSEGHRSYPTPCSYIRLLLPLCHPYCAQDLDVLTVTADEIFAYRADFLLLNRVSLVDLEKIEAVLAHCEREGISVVYDLDDDLLAIEDHPEKSHYLRYRPAVLRLLSGADLVWVSSTELQRRVASLCARCEVIPNALDESLWRRPPCVVAKEKTRPVRIVYMGTSTHLPDFRLIEPALEKLHREFKSEIEIEAIGVLPRDKAPSWCRVVEPPPSSTASYPGFVRWLISRPASDIGLCPLADAPFNLAKSEIKFLDYAALGAVSVCSDVEPYKRAIISGKNGLLVPNDTDAWYRALRSLVIDVELRQSLRHGAEQTLRDEYALKKLAAVRLESLQRLRAQVRPAHHRSVAVLDARDAKLPWLGESALCSLLADAFLLGDGVVVRNAEWDAPSELRNGSALSGQRGTLARIELPFFTADGMADESSLVSLSPVDYVNVGRAWQLAKDPRAAVQALGMRLAPGGRMLFVADADYLQKLLAVVEELGASPLGLAVEFLLHLPKRSVVIVRLNAGSVTHVVHAPTAFEARAEQDVVPKKLANEG